MATTSNTRVAVPIQSQGVAAFMPVEPHTSPFTMIAAGGADDQDNSGTYTNPESHTSGSGRQIAKFTPNMSKYVMFRLKRDDGDTVTGTPVGRPMGRRLVPQGTSPETYAVGPWERLRKSDGSTSHTFTTSSDDAADGTWQYTDWSPLFDRNGCDEIIIGLTTAYAATGSSALATIEGLLA